VRTAAPLTHRDQDEQQPEQQLQHADPRGRLAVVGRVGRRGEREHDHADGPEPDEPTEHDAGPFTRGCGVTSIKITAMIGTGLSAIPTASGRICPIASPTCQTRTTQRNHGCAIEVSIVCGCRAVRAGSGWARKPLRGGDRRVLDEGGAGDGGEFRERIPGAGALTRRRRTRSSTRS
jgi:hypothetical protein